MATLDRFQGFFKKKANDEPDLTQIADQDMADISAYFASQQMSVGAADPKLIERGEALFRGGKLAEGMPSCTGCHSPDGAGLGRRALSASGRRP